jgi:alkylation response protein AidB-like acyl-CoA dehydrogenase
MSRLTQLFAPVYERIAAGAVDREGDRRLPFEQVEWLREAGFGRLRVPEELGGLGATFRELVEQLVELGRADSNLPQLLRGHVGFVESRLVHPDPVARERWLRVVADGALVGNAQSEQRSASFWENATRLTPDPLGEGWRLDGEKFYSTGSLFADWILTAATVDADTSATVLVRADAHGVTRVDDWDGFGQRLTGSGTTRFAGVHVPDADVEPYPNGQLAGTTLLAVYQLVHLATLAGIGRAAVADTVRFVGQRSRNLLNPAHPEPGDDPLVQQVVGRLAGASFAADAVTLAAADVVDEVHRRQLEGTATAADFDRADVAAFSAQGQVIDLVLGLVTQLFEVGGASAVRERHRLDRHWRNARTLASHNPAIYRDRTVGDFVLNGTSPSAALAASWADVQRLRPSDTDPTTAGVPA